MERHGSDKYPVTFLQKTFKELEAAGKTAITSANDASADGTNGVKDGEAVKEEDTGKGGGDNWRAHAIRSRPAMGEVSRTERTWRRLIWAAMPRQIKRRSYFKDLTQSG